MGVRQDLDELDDIGRKDEVQEFISRNQHQFGYIMQEASRQWVAKDPVGALTVGDCNAVVLRHGQYHELLEKIEKLEKMQAELTRVIARNLIAWDTSKDKREGLLPEVYLTNKYLYKQLTGEEYYKDRAIKKFHIGDEYS